jgi:hypothetical protein
VSRNKSASHPRRLESFVHPWRYNHFGVQHAVSHTICMYERWGRTEMNSVHRHSFSHAEVQLLFHRMTLMKTALWSFETPGTTLPMTRRHIFNYSATLLRGPQDSRGRNPFLKVWSNITWCNLTQTATADHNCTNRQGCHHFSALLMITAHKNILD